MEHGIDFVILLDIYGELLSKGQRDALSMRYNEDLSLAEIAAESGGVTRQSVVSSIRKGEQRLLELAECLGFAKRLRSLSGKLKESETILAELSADYNKDMRDERFAQVGSLLSDIGREL